jgi:hypothetical protein
MHILRLLTHSNAHKTYTTCEHAYEYYEYNITQSIIQFIVDQKKVKLSLSQAVEARRVVRRRGSHIF